MNPNKESITEPIDANSGTPQRVFKNDFGTNLSYVNAVDSFIFNVIPDFSIDNQIGDYDSTVSESYQNLKDLRKNLITNAKLTVDVGQNLSEIENFVSSIDSDGLSTIVPGKTQLNFSYDVKNDVLFRSKIKNAKLNTELNANNVVGSSSLTEPTITSFVNNSVKDSNINILNQELSVSSVMNDKFKESNINVLLNELNITSSISSLGTAAGFNPNGEIVGTKLYNITSENLSIKSNAVSLNTVDLENFGKGIYQLQLVDNQKIFMERVVVD